MEQHIRFIGAMQVLLALVHIIFPKYFNWKEQLSLLSLINKQMMYVHTFFIGLVLLLLGTLCLSSATDLATTPLGHRISLGLALFWVCRLVMQFVGYSSSLWKGKAFETVVHIVFSIAWGYMSIVFTVNVFRPVM